jgi:hypothetical protein
MLNVLDVFTVCREAYPSYELGRLKSLVTLWMEAMCSSETSVPTRATRCNISNDIRKCTAVKKNPKYSVLRPSKFRDTMQYMP